MADFKISRIRYTWKGTWTTAILYKRDDIVRYGANSYVCIRQHTANLNFYTDLYFIPPGETEATPRWVKMTDGFSFRGSWQTSTGYNLGDVISYAGTLYLCTTNHTSSALFETDSANWTVYISAASWNDEWTEATRYGVGDLVRYNGIVYKCVEGHTSGTTEQGLEIDQAKWSYQYEGLQFVGSWTIPTRYRVNDLVKYGGSLFKCTAGHTSYLNFHNANFTVYLPGFNYTNDWNSETNFAVGDVTRYGGWLYYCKENHTNQIPSDSALYTDRYWAIISKGINFLGDWNSTTKYKTGDVVRRGGQLYTALSDTAQNDGSSIDYLDSSNWEIIIPGEAWKNTWNQGTTYALGDLIIFDGSLYRCTFEHIASGQNFPGDNGSGFDYWTLVLQAGENVGLRSQGDLLTFDLNRRLQGDGSSLGITNVEIGEASQILTITDENSLNYKTFGVTPRARYVSPDGIDDATRGRSPYRPWKTIKFACEQVEADNFNGKTNIAITTGVYEEILPIIVPKGTALVGDELRSVRVKPMQAMSSLSDDVTYMLALITRMREVLPAIIVNDENLVPTTGNNEELNLGSLGTNEQADGIRSLVDDITEYLQYHLQETGSDVAVTGSNLSRPGVEWQYARDMLANNADFILAEGLAFMDFFYPLYDYDVEFYTSFIHRLRESIQYDLIHPGNYKSLWAARYYKNAQSGSQEEDMFYVRDATGVRNMILEGLTGSVSDTLEYILFYRPLGPSFVSLDPGWGPDDDRTWITTRSCYVQNVTTAGLNCTGQKIDGALHNGGNRSIVSNDFTQVISDGIGAHVLNNGRAELVSVFTYYAKIGYLAENGGVIRATNGNNSYGDYGALAIGNDPSETPRSATVNNRNQEAIVATAFAGEVNDEILILEFQNPGQDYTEANYSIIGSGVNAQLLQDEFRDKGVFDCKVINPQDSTTAGGSGYIVAGNNAQTGDLTTITLASNDENTESQYLGLRIILTSGTGTGQYGLIGAYNELTKAVSVIRESDGQPGWDHVTPGWPLQNPLTSSTVYRIEPRPIFENPGFTSQAITAPVSTNWTNIAYGETRATFTNVAVSTGLAGTEGQPPITATFDVVRLGRKYTVTMRNPGAGYGAGEELLIPGVDLGGVSPDNDITVTVLTSSDDSTNSILTFEYEGIGTSGHFMMVPGTGTSAIYSKDAITWQDSILPADRNWKCLATGNNLFVTIAYGSNSAATSTDGITWTSRTMPASRNWNAVVYGKFAGRWVAVAGDQGSYAHSTNGTSWTLGTLPSLDSSANEWVDITYGKGKFVALSNSQNEIAVSDNGTTWEAIIMDVIADSSSKDWVSIEYGNNRFVAISSTGDIGYSFDGLVWYPATMPTLDGSTPMKWTKMSYGQGVFFAVCDTGSRTIGGEVTTGPTTYAATSEDGINWTPRTLSSSLNWSGIGFGNPDITLDDSTILDVGNRTGIWVAISGNPATSTINRIRTGSLAKGRVVLSGGRVDNIKIWDPGSGYNTEPTLTIFDPNNTGREAYFRCRIADGVLAQPSWINRGVGYKTSTTTVTVSGDGFADLIPNFRTVTLSNLSRYPGPGAQLRFDGNSQIYTAVVITPLGNLNGYGLSALIQTAPNWNTDNGPEHNTEVEIRERYSQCRITGHDFLDIGTGNFVETNYPELYETGQFFSAPENEVAEADGGRVFYTSTDQSGNFRGGELFAVEQATGIVTISADFFDLNGLSELRLGGIRIGGSGAVVREFSTDPLFVEDSNNVVPTQRAIKQYLANRLSVGGSDIATASFIAGLVRVGPNQISNTIGRSIIIPRRADFEGSATQLNGTILAQTMFHRASRLFNT